MTLWRHRAQIGLRAVAQHTVLGIGGRTILLVSTPSLAARYAPLSPMVLPPMLEIERTRPPVSRARPVVVFHATASHDAEHAFVAAVARRVLAAGHRVTFDVVASPHTANAWQGLPDVVVRAPMAWDRFGALPDTLGGDLLLAPLEDNPLNRMRSATKAIDAVRLGAAGIFADLAPYHPVREAGPLLPRDVDGWAGEISALLDSEPRLADRKQRLRQIVETWATVQFHRQTGDVLFPIEHHMGTWIALIHRLPESMSSTITIGRIVSIYLQVTVPHRIR